MIQLTEKELKNYLETVHRFQKEFSDINQSYKTDLNLKEIENKLHKLARNYKKYVFVATYYVNYGDELIAKGEKEAGILYLQIATEVFGAYADEITCFLRFAEYYIEKGEMEKGISYLIKLCCETTDNYEESIEFRELTHVWERYKTLVEGKVPASISINEKTTPLAPAECSMQIQEILNLPQDALLLELSTHLYELSGGGDYLNYLNKWERCVYYLDTLCVDINSDGIDFFVEYHGTHLSQTKKAMEELGIHNGVQLLEDIQEKRKRHIEDFKTEEDFYYKFVEKDLLEGLYTYVINHKSRFR